MLGEADLASCELVPYGVMTEALAAVERGEVDAAFVPIENAIEGTVNLTLDALIFDHDLLIQREVVKRIVMNLLDAARPGHRRHRARADAARRPRAVPRVAAWPTCPRRSSWRRTPPPTRRASSVSALSDPASAAGTPQSVLRCRPRLYGLDVAATDIEDHPDNATRFVLVRPNVIPAPTGHDKTSIVCFQRADTPGSSALDPRPVHGPQHQPDQARESPHQGGPRQLLLHHRLRGPHRRRGGLRLPAGPARVARRR